MIALRADATMEGFATIWLLISFVLALMEQKESCAKSMRMIVS